MIKLEGFESRRHQDNTGKSSWTSNRASNLPDPDPIFTKEWIESILAVNKNLGPQEARRLLLETVQAAIDAGVDIDVSILLIPIQLQLKIRAIILETWHLRSAFMM